ncbi:hypothetical protein ABZS71_06685 [Streptomyces sp. NPDC005393]|uniref:hypothetical protein n=1 Tax=Streptomyces sp. NPDC005393 TaxID=3157041 RepID=UPI0033A5B29A
MAIIEKPTGALWDDETGEYLYPDAWMVEQGHMRLRIVDGEPVIRVTESGIEYIWNLLKAEDSGVQS